MMKIDSFKSFSAMCLLCTFAAMLLHSCGSSKNYVVPYAVSTVGVTTVKDLKLNPDQYEIIQTVTETASVICQYSGTLISVKSGDGDFSYQFILNKKNGWQLKSFQGAAEMGYFAEDIDSSGEIAVPNPEEFARRVAMARIIKAVTDYGADGIVEPVTTTRVDNAGNNKIEYTTTVRAKLISIKPTN